MAKKTAQRRPEEGGAKRLIAFGGIAIIIILIAGAYLVLKQLANPAAPQPPGGVGPGVNYTPQQATPAEYSISPLIAEFGIDSSPVLVFNCNYEREGTFATKEQSGQISVGTERQDIINALCSASGKASICAYQRALSTSGALLPLSSPVCAEGSKVRVYAFYSPSCGNSANQRPILEGVAALFPDDVNVTYVCTPIFEGDLDACKSQVASGKFDE